MIGRENGGRSVMIGSFFNSSTPDAQNRYLIHEMLHAYTGKGDIDLASTLGLGSFGNTLAAGTAIDNYLKVGCDMEQYKKLYQ